MYSYQVSESMSELRNVFEKANTHLAKVKDDPEFVVSKYWANLEADQVGATILHYSFSSQIDNIIF